MRATSLLLIAALALLLASCGGGPRLRAMRGDEAFQVLLVLDGEAKAGDVLVFAAPGKGSEGATTVTGFWDHRRDFQGVPCGGPDAIQMVLAFQFAEGKGPDDFRAFKELDKPWVAANNGCNPSTVFTQRDGRWPFDAFEIITFASMADFERAYAGNDALAAAGEGLFGPKVLAAVVQPVELRAGP
jgi:hypothetical protein